MTRYRLKVPIPAIHDMREDRDVRVTLPAVAMLVESPQHSTTLMGMVGVYWEGRHYSVHPRDLFSFLKLSVPAKLLVDHRRGNFFRKHLAGHPEQGFQAFNFRSSRRIRAGPASTAGHQSRPQACA
jgi:hypothetical protein